MLQHWLALHLHVDATVLKLLFINWLFSIAECVATATIPVFRSSLEFLIMHGTSIHKDETPAALRAVYHGSSFRSHRFADLDGTNRIEQIATVVDSLFDR